MAPRKRPNPFNPDDYQAYPMPTRPPRGPGIPVGPHKGGGGKPYTGKGPRNFKVNLKNGSAAMKKKRKKNGQVYDAKGHLVDKPTGVLIGKDKGMYRKTKTGYQKRRFTIKQRQTFRAKKGPVFGGPKDGRPSA